jgi:hypothetical protein
MRIEMGIFVRSLARTICMVGLMLAIGCERKPAPPGDSQSTPATQPSTQPATGPSTVPSTEPTASLMVIDQRIVSFPPAKLRVRQKRAGDPVVAVLFSDDPKAAIDDNYTGNSYYLEMTLDIANPGDLAQGVWTYKSPTSERANSTNGIFLDGTHVQLQPLEVRVEFEQRGNEIGVMLQGHFLQFDANDPNIGRMVQVSANLTAKLP